MRRVGYKRGILVGLLICASGTLLFLPALYVTVFGGKPPTAEAAG